MEWNNRAYQAVIIIDVPVHTNFQPPYKHNTHQMFQEKNHSKNTQLSPASSKIKMKRQPLPEFVKLPGDDFFDDACILDMDYFVKTLAGIKAKGVRTDLIGPIIAHYASKWLPDLSGDVASHNEWTPSKFGESPGSVTASWMKKRFFVETLVGILPPEKDSISCNFLLRLLRTGNMVGVDYTYRAELEKRISWQLDQASLKELMIPSFNHTCGTLLDVELAIRLVKRFLGTDEVAKSGASFIKVAKLVDSYLAEVATDSNLGLEEFVALSSSLPSHARASDDGLYRAIDTYLKAHPGLSKQDRKTLCSLIDSGKLSSEASRHAVQNDRLPVRSVIQILFTEQTKLYKNIDWSGSFTSSRSPNPASFDPPAKCLSKREMTTQQMEIRRLREDVLRLQGQCYALQAQLENMEKKKGLFYKWRKLGIIPSFNKSVGYGEEKIEEVVDRELENGYGKRTPLDLKAKIVKGKTPLKWRKSAS